MRKKGPYPAVLIGADEVAVDLFIKKKIRFTDIVPLVEETLSSWTMSEFGSLDDMIFYVLEAARSAMILSKKFRD